MGQIFLKPTEFSSKKKFVFHYNFMLPRICMKNEETGMFLFFDNHTCGAL